MPDKANFTQEFIRQCLDYNPKTGVLIWLPRPREYFATQRSFSTWNSRFVGAEAGICKAKPGYHTIGINGQTYYTHRIIWFLVHGEWPEAIDHINGDGRDNRLANIRGVTRSINMRNMKRNVRNASGHNGIKQANSRWNVTFLSRSLGSYDTLREAIQVRRRYERRAGGFTDTHGRR